jgi:hypothetical protein
VTSGRTTWLGIGCPEGQRDGPERPVALHEARQESEPA